MPTPGGKISGTEIWKPETPAAPVEEPKEEQDDLPELS